MKAKRQGKQPAPTVRALAYKVIELSVVDEATIERTLNEWVCQGWKLDGIQFAMRESSKRPSMAFVLFTREKRAAAAFEDEREHLAADKAKMGSEVSAWERLAQLAGDDDR